MTREHAMQEPETAYEPAEADPLVLLDGHMGRILLAEDDEEFRSLVAAVLRADGYEVVEVADGFDLLQHIALSLIDGGLVEPVNLVVSDIRMPGWSGLEVLASARTAGFDVPFILITAFGDPETHAQARRLDAVAVLDKPFDLDDLRDLVRSTAPIRLALGVEARK
jgi:CheY-like chemotaxis protein